MTTEGFIPLPLPVPPLLESYLGYPGGLIRPEQELARHVAFYWVPGGDEGAFHDGRISQVKINNNVYLAFVRHRAVAPHLRPYNLGASDTEADHWLVLDREERKLYVAPVETAYLFLVQQWGLPLHEPPLEVASIDDLQQLEALTMDHWTETITVFSYDQAMRLVADEQNMRDTLITWLDLH